MAKRHHAKSKDKRVQEKLDLINRSTERRPLPRPAIFKDKSKYDRKRSKRELRACCA